MIDTSNWNYFYKVRNGVHSTTNMLYTPLVSPNGDMMCMRWDKDSPYQADNTKLTTDLIDFFFEREVKYIKLLEHFDWAPNIYEIDLTNKNIIIEWNKETLNTILFVKEQNLNDVCPDWKDQIFQIVKDIVDYGYYKMALYPHCFFIDTRGKIKTFDFYGCIEKDNAFVERSKIAGMIGPDSANRFDMTTTKDGIIDLNIFFSLILFIII